MNDKKDKKNYEIFDGKTLSDVFKDIYNNSTTTRTQIDGLIQQLKTLIGNKIENAVVVVPLIKEYLEIVVKNDELKVKLSEIVQRLLREVGAKRGEDGSFILSEEDKEQILSEVTDYETMKRKEIEQKRKVDEKVEKVKKEFNNEFKKEEKTNVIH